MKELIITGINLDTVWKDKEENFRRIATLAEDFSGDILLLPEMFGTGFCMDAAEIADREDEHLLWMKAFAAEKNCAVAGTAAVFDRGKYYNRFYFAEASGKITFYDKRHLFSYAGENRFYTSGNDRIIVTIEGWRILLQTCYDLRFPVFSRNRNDYDAVIYLANWPESRIDAWLTLLKARAIENQSYVFGLNRVGTDGNGLHYPESSCCFFADGSEISHRKAGFISAELNMQKLGEYRDKFRFLADADNFSLE